MDKTRTS